MLSILMSFPTRDDRICSALQHWSMKAYHWLECHPEFDRVVIDPVPFREPVDSARNYIAKTAIEGKYDLLLMADEDMSPDYLLNQPKFQQQPFLEVAMEHMVRTGEVCVIGAPYCKAPPREAVNVFELTNDESDNPDPQWFLRNVPRLDASRRTGLKRVQALGTGLNLWHVRAFQHLKHPYFRFLYTDQTCAEIACSEDVYATRNLALQGVPVYCAWDSWASHWKNKEVGKPAPLTGEQVAKHLVGAIEDRLALEFEEKNRDRLLSSIPS